MREIQAAAIGRFLVYGPGMPEHQNPTEQILLERLLEFAA
jgi:hypothetical protein